jgi:hypothetical protein
MMAGRGGKAIPAFLCSLPTIIFLYHAFLKTQASQTLVFSGIARKKGKPLDCNPTREPSQVFQYAR